MCYVSTGIIAIARFLVTSLKYNKHLAIYRHSMFDYYLLSIVLHWRMVITTYAMTIDER